MPQMRFPKREYQKHATPVNQVVEYQIYIMPIIAKKTYIDI